MVRRTENVPLDPSPGAQPITHQPFFSYIGAVTPLSSDPSPPLGALTVRSALMPLAGQVPLERDSSPFPPSACLVQPWWWGDLRTCLVLPSAVALGVGVEGLKLKVTELTAVELATQRRDRCVVFTRVFLGPRSHCVCCQSPL